MSVTRVERVTGVMPELNVERCDLSDNGQPYLSLDVNEILLMYDMREQTTKLCLQFSSMFLCNHSIPGPAQHSKAQHGMAWRTEYGWDMISFNNV